MKCQTLLSQNKKNIFLNATCCCCDSHFSVKHFSIFTGYILDSQKHIDTNCCTRFSLLAYMNCQRKRRLKLVSFLHTDQEMHFLSSDFIAANLYSTNIFHIVEYYCCITAIFPAESFNFIDQDDKFPISP